MRPGRVKEFEFDLRRIYKLDEVGTYRFVAQREVVPVEGPNEIVVVSEPFYLTFIPGIWEGVSTFTNGVPAQRQLKKRVYPEYR